MVAVGKDLILVRQVGAARIDEIDAGQAVRLGDLLRAEMLLDGHRIVSAAFYRRVVADDHRLPPRYAPDARDHPRARNLAAIHVARRKLADLEKGRARIEQPLDALARQQFAAARVALARIFLGAGDRESGVWGKRVLGRVDLG